MQPFDVGVVSISSKTPFYNKSPNTIIWFLPLPNMVLHDSLGYKVTLQDWVYNHVKLVGCSAGNIAIYLGALNCLQS